MCVYVCAVRKAVMFIIEGCGVIEELMLIVNQGTTYSGFLEHCTLTRFPTPSINIRSVIIEHGMIITLCFLIFSNTFSILHKTTPLFTHNLMP